MSEDFLTKKEGQEMMEIVKGIREKAEKYGIDSPEYKSYVENSDKKIAELDKKNENIVASIETEKKEKKELKERIKHLEVIAAGNNGNTKKDTRKDADIIVNAITKKNWGKLINENQPLAESYFKEMGDLLVPGLPDFPTEAKQFQNIITEFKASPDILRTDIGELGGFLVPIEWSSELLRQMIEASPFRKYSRTKNTTGKTLMQPIRQGVPTALWQGETEEGTSSTSNYVLEELTPHRLTHTVPITWDMLNDAGYNISEELMTDSRLAFAIAEGTAMVSGNGVKRPLGFTVDPAVPQYDSATNTLKMDDVIKITGELKSGYDPMYSFNRRTLAYLRTLKDTTERYLWAGPFGDAAAGAPATINGYRYSSEFIDMDDFDVGDGFPILFADFFRFYCVLDRTDIIVIRDEYTRKKEAIVEFTIMRWTHGQPIVKEAGILLKKIA